MAHIVAGHEFDGQMLDAMHGESLELDGHAWFETSSVLTRLPQPARRNRVEVIAIMNHNCPESRYCSAQGHRDLADRINALGIAGSAVYDALLSAVAAEHELTPGICSHPVDPLSDSPVGIEGDALLDGYRIRQI